MRSPTRTAELLSLLCRHEDAGYEELLPDTVVLQVGDLQIRVLSLPRLIEAKQRAGRPKDLAALPLLHATLSRSRGPT